MTSSILLKRLCSQITGINDEERLSQHYELAVNLLSEGLHTEHNRDYHNVGDRIKKLLVRDGRLEDAARFSNLLDKIERSNILQNKASILLLFLNLSQDTPSCSSSHSQSSSISSTPLPNEDGLIIGQNEDFFHLSSLHNSASHGSSSSGPQSRGSRPGSSINYEDMEYCGSRELPSRGPTSRVASLAALYKGGVNNNKNILPALDTHNYDRTKPPDKLATSSSTNHPSQVTNYRKHTQVEVSEECLVREVLFIFQGIEGKIIKMDLSKDSFRIDNKVRLSNSRKELLLKLAEIGWLYIEVKKFCESHSRISGDQMTEHSSTSIGLVTQAFVVALREELNEYCRLIAVLEAQVHDSGGGDTPMEDSSGGLTLRRLLLWTLEPRDTLHTLALLTNAARQLKGGALVSTVYMHLHHGDLSHVSVVRRSLSQACTPLFYMLTQWLLDGTLEDPHHEFFIAADPTVPDMKLWQDKYGIRWCMLPTFVNHAQAVKVLATGKSLNFLRHVCQFRTPISGRNAIKAALTETTVESLFSQDENNQLNRLLDLTFRETSNHVLEEILTQHKLLDHLRALRRYLLLGQGDFIHYLMEILGPELRKPASHLYPHNLSSLLETAVIASNAQFEEPDILKRLDVRLLEASPGDTGWDVFSLDYHVDGPIGTVFTGDCMAKYLMLFNSLWRAKHMEWILSATWKQQSATCKLCRDLPELQSTLHGVQLLLTEMIHLVQQMAYYMTFEVLECSWHALMTCLKSAQSLDDIINAHCDFLKHIVSGALLDKESEDVRIPLRTQYDLMVRLEQLQERLSNAVIGEVNSRKTFQDESQARTDAGDYGTCDSLEEKEMKRRREFTTKLVPKIKSELKILTTTYQDMVQNFLLKLAQHENENLHLLSIRLDFNEYYHRRDYRLNQRLTYQHKRKSMGSSFC